MSAHPERPALLAVVLAAGQAGGDPVTGTAVTESLSDAAGVPCVDVAPVAWRVVLSAVRDIGGRLDWLGGVDLTDDATRLPGDPMTGPTAVLALVFDDEADVLIRVELGPGETLASVADIFPGADWHERETAELLGVEFAGGSPRGLLLGESDPAVPLRRAVPLDRRVSTPWPGAVEGGRRARVPGVNPEWGSG